MLYERRMKMFAGGGRHGKEWYQPMDLSFKKNMKKGRCPIRTDVRREEGIISRLLLRVLRPVLDNP